VRVFSEGPRWQGHEELAAQIRSLGGENDAPSRNISRYLDTLADDLKIGLDVMQVWRNDRFGRGGDHTEFLNAGFPAVRFSVAVENYDWQHQDVRVENGKPYGDTVDKMDFPYLEKVTKLNIAALAAIASAPPPPERIEVEGAVSTDTQLRWSWHGEHKGSGYRVHWRRTDAAQWQHSKESKDSKGLNDANPVICARQEFYSVRDRPETDLKRYPYCVVTLPHIRVDDWVFGVSSVSADGFESPVASAVPGGAFKPWVAPVPAPPENNYLVPPLDGEGLGRGDVRRRSRPVKHHPPREAITRARRLRRDMTDAERAMWRLLREAFPDWHFRRQVPIRCFIVDFASHRAKLVIEVDGGQHAAEADAPRSATIEEEGYRVFRFWNH
jgi:very-short-patch-repair endonuclease